MLTSVLFLAASVVSCHATLPSKQPPRNCTQPGPICETCTNVVICLENSDGTWSKNPIGTCSKDENCFNGTCTTNPEPICDGTADLDFICSTVGIFPDPFRCNKFVMCIDRNGRGKFVSYTYECSDGYGYNARTATCDVPLDGGQCAEGQYPVPVCRYVGQSGALEDNPSIYYTCEEYSKKKKELYPVLDKCPHGEEYRNYGCHAGGDGGGTTGTVAGTTAPVAGTTSPVAGTTTTPLR